MADQQLDKAPATTPDHDPAVAKPAEKGPGELEVRAMMKIGWPPAAKVVAVIDKHPDERDAIMTALHRNLGAAYVRQVVAAMKGHDVAAKPAAVAAPATEAPATPAAATTTETAKAATPAHEAPASEGYFHVSKADKTASWSTAGGGFTGKADKTGLDSTAKLGAHDDLHAKVDVKDKSGTVDWNHDGKQEAELYGKKTDAGFEAGVRREDTIGDGKLTTGVEHVKGKDSSTNDVHAEYASKTDRASAKVGATDGKAIASVDELHTFADGSTAYGAASYDGKTGTTELGLTGVDKIDKDRTLSGGAAITHDAKGTAEELKGAYQTKDNTLSGSVSHDAAGVTKVGVDDTYKLDKDRTLSGSASVTHDGKGTAEEAKGTYKTKDNTVTGSVSHDAAGVTKVGVDDTYQLDKDRSISGSAAFQHGPTGNSESINGTYKTKNNTLNGSVSHDEQGTTKVTANDTYQLDKDRSISGNASFQHGATGDLATLGGSYKSKDLAVDGSLTRHEQGQLTGDLTGKYTPNANTTIEGGLHRTADTTSANIGGTHKFSEADTLSGSLAYDKKDGSAGETVLKMHEDHKAANAIGSADLEMGTGARDYAKASGGLDLRLRPDMYAGAFGDVTAERGKDTQAHLGASLTWTPDEKSALTLAGIVNQDGALETRLQYDVFKDKLDGLTGISQHKKDAMLSVFVSYTTKGNAGMLNDRYGAPQFSPAGMGGGAGGGQVQAGIVFRF